MAESGPFTVTYHDEAVVVGVEARTLDESVASGLHDTLIALTSEAKGRPFVVDLGRVEFAPSIAIGTLVRLNKAFSLDGNRFALAAVNRRVYKTLMVTRVTTLLQIYGSVTEALEAFRNGAD